MCTRVSRKSSPVVSTRTEVLLVPKCGDWDCGYCEECEGEEFVGMAGCKYIFYHTYVGLLTDVYFKRV